MITRLSVVALQNQAFPIDFSITFRMRSSCHNPSITSSSAWKCAFSAAHRMDAVLREPGGPFTTRHDCSPSKKLTMSARFLLRSHGCDPKRSRGFALATSFMFIGGGAGVFEASMLWSVYAVLFLRSMSKIL